MENPIDQSQKQKSNTQTSENSVIPQVSQVPEINQDNLVPPIPPQAQENPAIDGSNPNDNKTLLFSIAGLLILIIVGVVGYIFYSGVFDKDILTKTAEASSKIKSYKQKLTLTLKDKDQVIGTVEGIIETDLFLNRVKAIFNTKVDSLVITSESRRIGDTIFVKVSATDAIHGEFLLPFFSGDWIQFNANESVTEGYEKINNDNLKFQNSLLLFKEGTGYLSIKEEFEEENLNGNVVSHYSLNLSPSFVDEISEESLKDFYRELANNGTIEVWINTKDFFVQKIQYTTPNLISVIEVTDINELINIERPLRPIPYKDWIEQLLASLSEQLGEEVELQDLISGSSIEGVLRSLNTARIKTRDALRSSDIAILRLALELYYDENGSYPFELSSVVISEILEQIPSDPLGGQGLCRPEYCYAYSNDFQSYHLGAQLENEEDVRLLEDKDFNSRNKGFQGTPFDGADSLLIYDETEQL